MSHLYIIVGFLSLLLLEGSGIDDPGQETVAVKFRIADGTREDALAALKVASAFFEFVTMKRHEEALLLVEPKGRQECRKILNQERVWSAKIREIQTQLRQSAEGIHELVAMVSVEAIVSNVEVERGSQTIVLSVVKQQGRWWVRCGDGPHLKNKESQSKIQQGKVTYFGDATLEEATGVLKVTSEFCQLLIQRKLNDALLLVDEKVRNEFREAHANELLLGASIDLVTFWEKDERPRKSAIQLRMSQQKENERENRIVTILIHVELRDGRWWIIRRFKSDP